MSDRGASGIAPVTSIAVGDVRVKRPALELETERSIGLARRLGNRARRWLKAHEHEEAVQEVIGVTKDGEPITRDVVVPAEVVDAIKTHGKIVSDLLKEQRARASLGKGAGALPLSDAEFEAELIDLAREVLRTMPESEFELLLLERNAIAASAVERTTGGEL